MYACEKHKANPLTDYLNVPVPECIQCRIEQQRKAALGEKAMRTLESLTPSGSEFVNDPERCAAWVKEVHAAQLTAIRRFKLQTEAKAALVEEFLQLATDAVYRWSLVVKSDQSFVLGYAQELVEKLKATIPKAEKAGA